MSDHSQAHLSVKCAKATGGRDLTIVLPKCTSLGNLKLASDLTSSRKDV